MTRVSGGVHKSTPPYYGALRASLTYAPHDAFGLLAGTKKPLFGPTEPRNFCFRLLAWMVTQIFMLGAEMKYRRLIAAMALLAMLWGSDAVGQSEPIPGYYELQVAYCWGMYAAMIPENKVMLDQACGSNFKSTLTYNCQSVTTSTTVWQDQTNKLRDYLFTGTTDHGANSGAAIAIALGRQFASDLLNGSPQLTGQEIKERSTECINVIKELPY